MAFFESKPEPRVGYFAEQDYMHCRGQCYADADADAAFGTLLPLSSATETQIRNANLDRLPLSVLLHIQEYYSGRHWRARRMVVGVFVLAVQRDR